MSGTHPAARNPEPLAQPAVPDLDLVRDGQATAVSHFGVDLGQVSGGQRQAAGVAVERLGQERGGRPVAGPAISCAASGAYRLASAPR